MCDPLPHGETGLKPRHPLKEIGFDLGNQRIRYVIKDRMLNRPSFWLVVLGDGVAHSARERHREAVGQQARPVDQP